MALESVEKAGARCTDAEIAAFCDLVRKGDEVDPDGLEGRVRRARLLSFGTSEGALVAVAGIKNPYTGYRAGVFDKSRSELSPLDFGVELGWVMVDDAVRRRGYGRHVLERVLASLRGERIYTTSRAVNKPMHALLLVHGFELAGRPWRSGRGPYDLVLHVRR